MLKRRLAFRDEYAALSLGKPIPKKSQLIKLNPCMDEDGAIKSDGRLKFAEFFPYDTRFPIILPRGLWVIRLIVKNYHERANHAAGINFILCQLSERFSIIAAREDKATFYFLTLRLDSCEFRRYSVYRSRTQKTSTEKGGCACLPVWKHKQCN